MFEGGGRVGKVGAEVGAAGFFAGEGGGYQDAGEGEKVGGFEVVDGSAVDVASGSGFGAAARRSVALRSMPAWVHMRVWSSRRVIGLVRSGLEPAA